MAGVIPQGDVWMEALDVRNKMSHTYNSSAFEDAIAAIRARFLDLLDSLFEKLLVESINLGKPR